MSKTIFNKKRLATIVLPVALSAGSFVIGQYNGRDAERSQIVDLLRIEANKYEREVVLDKKHLENLQQTRPGSSVFDFAKDYVRWSESLTHGYSLAAHFLEQNYQQNKNRE